MPQHIIPDDWRHGAVATAHEACDTCDVRQKQRLPHLRTAASAFSHLEHFVAPDVQKTGALMQLHHLRAIAQVVTPVGLTTQSTIETTGRRMTCHELESTGKEAVVAYPRRTPTLCC
jgi:hypothetical protein